MPTALGLHFFAAGADNFGRPPAFLIHGAGGHQLYWPPGVRRLHGQRVFAMDLPGHGKSAGIGHQRIEDYSTDILAFMSDLRLNAAVLIGHSMGGAIALDIAIRHPRRVLGLGLLGTGARLRVDPLILKDAGRADHLQSAIRLLGDRSFSKSSSPRLKELALSRMSEMRPSVLYGDLLACEAFDRMTEVSRISCTTLVLCGADDQMTPLRYSNYLHENITGSRLQVIPGAGHMLMLERPNAVAEELLKLLDSIPFEPGR